MSQTAPSMSAFAYQAQTLEGQPTSGTIDAADLEQAQRLLATMRLRVLQLDPVAPAARPKRLSPQDFIAFNQQLAHLTKAGLPVEQGLRLIARDMRSGRLADTIQTLAAEMERGTPLEQAFENQKQTFPPLYARLIAAGVKSGDLPGMLLNMGRHLELVYRLRAALWRAVSYPLMVLVALALVLTFVCLKILPQFHDIFQGFGTRLPLFTQLLLDLPRIMPAVGIVIAGLIALLLLIALILHTQGLYRPARERILLSIPLIGPIVRNNLVARWCDAVKVSVDAGLDLPAAIDLASDAIGSPRLRRDGDEISSALQAGRLLETVEHTRILPATVVAAISLAGEHHDLSSTLAMLSEMYQQQSDLRLALLPGVLTPMLVIFVALLIGAVILALFAPLISILRAISG